MFEEGPRVLESARGPSLCILPEEVGLIHIIHAGILGAILIGGLISDEKHLGGIELLGLNPVHQHAGIGFATIAGNRRHLVRAEHRFDFHADQITGMIETFNDSFSGGVTLGDS